MSEPVDIADVREYVDPPPTPPRRYGLYSIASTPELEGRQAWGVEYDPDSCTIPNAVDTGPCQGVITKTASVEEDRIFGDPFAVFAALECRPVGRSLEEIRRRARRVLELGEEPAVEEALYPLLAAQATDVGTGSGLFLSPAIATLEQAFQEYGYSANIIMPRNLGAWMSNETLLWERDERILETSLGSRIAFVNAPIPTPGPGGDAGANEAWIYATGPIVIRRGEVETPGDVASTLTRIAVSGSDANNTFSLAERVIVPTIDCPVFAVLVADPQGGV